MSYRLKQGAPRHYLAGRFYYAGDRIPLPPGVKPGQWLEKVGAGASAPASSKPAKGKDTDDTPAALPADAGDADTTF